MASNPTLRLLADRIAAGEIPALSIKQPYPHHIFHDGKDVENRDWRTGFRGWFLVHAGVSRSECATGQLDLPRGGVVGIARITDCVQAMESRWFFGKFGFVLSDAMPLPMIACRGKLGFFYLPPDVNTAVAETLREVAA